MPLQQANNCYKEWVDEIWEIVEEVHSEISKVSL